MFTFFSLALVKRCADIKIMEKHGLRTSHGRDYNADDYSVLQQFGISSSLMSILMLAFFVNDTLSSNFYSEPQLLWLILPSFAYFFMRIWVKTSRSELNHDPIVFALSDKGSVLTIMFIAFVTILARLV
jgi:4-hydroxybenzoate polyprenyltransferase